MAQPLPAATAGPALPGDAVIGSGEAPASAPGGSNVVTGPLIVRTGQLALQVTALDDALAAAGKVVTAAGGYVASSQRQGDGDTAGATVTFRIPAERWDATLAALRAVGTKVLSEQTASEEVTSQVVDLGARLVNLGATETALQAIMAKATRIPDILEVQSQLTTVRQEIEQLTAQKQSLEKQAALGTLTVAFSLPPVVAVTEGPERLGSRGRGRPGRCDARRTWAGCGERGDLGLDRPAPAGDRPRRRARGRLDRGTPDPAPPNSVGAVRAIGPDRQLDGAAG